MHISRRGVGIGIFSVALISSACSDTTQRHDTPLEVPTVTRVGSSVSKEMAATLSPNGEIPVAVDNQPGSEISAHQAVELGLAYMKDFGPFNRSILEGAVAAPIDFSALTAEPRIFFAASPYEDLDGRFSRPSAKAMGPYYLITLSQRGTPVVSLAVSAKASDLRVENGHLKLPLVYGNEFWMMPITRRLRLPLTPEAAAVIANEGTGLTVSEAPLLVIPERANFVPQYSMWRVVGVPSGGAQESRNIASDTLYVTFDGKLLRRSDKGQADVRRLWSSGAGKARRNPALS